MIGKGRGIIETVIETETENARGKETGTTAVSKNRHIVDRDDGDRGGAVLG